MAKKITYRALTSDELESLQAFAAHYGKQWKAKLSMVYWYNARIFRDRSGKEHFALHRLRNELGPTWLDGFKLAAVES